MITIDFEESMENVSFDWSINRLEGTPLMQTKKALHQFLLSNTQLIKSEVAYGNGKGKYRKISCVPLLSILSKYEEYSIDLSKMIIACMDGDLDPVTQLEQRIVDATHIDQAFLERLFPAEETRTIGESLEAFDAIMGFESFINETLDRFQDLYTKGENARTDTKALLDLYAYSVTEFSKAFISTFQSYVERLEGIMKGTISSTPTKEAPAAEYILA